MSDERIQDNSGEELDDNIIILNDEEGKENRFEFFRACGHELCEAFSTR